jgi:hypothetical protein
MSTLRSRTGRAKRFGRRPLFVPLLAAGALAAGCGAAHTTMEPASTGPAGTGPAGTPGKATGPGAASATPVPTVSGGHFAAGGVACVGWPAGAVSAVLPVSFVPVSVERCVNGVQTVPGKGLWTTATLQRADAGLTALINALREPSATRQPGTVCPAMAVIPPQVVLISATGQKLIPQIPVGGCGIAASQVLVALDALRWQPVSVRLISAIPGATPPTPATPPTVTGSAPHSIQTMGAAPPG